MLYLKKILDKILNNSFCPPRFFSGKIGLVNKKTWGIFLLISLVSFLIIFGLGKTTLAQGGGCFLISQQRDSDKAKGMCENARSFSEKQGLTGYNIGPCYFNSAKGPQGAWCYRLEPTTTQQIVEKVSKAASLMSMSLKEVVDGALSLILRIALTGFGVLLGIFAQFFDWALGIAHFTEAPAVITGWGIVRDLVNLVLILILLIIAFATILRVETYGLKALLPKLIIVALLINFSLVMAGVVIDFTQVVADFFVDKAGGGSISTKIVNGLSMQETLKMSQGGWQTLEAVAAIPGNFIVGLLGGIVIILTAALVFALGAFLLIVRVIALWILLILVPGAMLCMILPAIRHLWDKWLHEFFKWAFFAPCYAFFAYLALVTIQKKAITQQITSSSQAISTRGWTMPNFLNSFLKFDTILMYIMVMGLLVGGLIVARQMGIYGAQGTIGVAKWVGREASRWTGRLGMRTALKMAPPPKKIKTKTAEGKEKVEFRGGLIQRGLSKIAKFPLAGKLATQALRGLEQTRATVAKEKESIKGWTTDHIKDTFDRANAEGKVARMLELYERDDLNELSSKQLEKGLKLAQRYGQESKLIRALPGLAKKIGKDIQKTISKTKPSAAAKIAPSELDNNEVVNAIIQALRTGQWTSAHLGKIASENPALRVKIQEKIMTKENVESFAPHVKSYLDSYLGSSLYGIEK
jgi:hypothetical protein